MLLVTKTYTGNKEIASFIELNFLPKMAVKGIVSLIKINLIGPSARGAS